MNVLIVEDHPLYAQAMMDSCKDATLATTYEQAKQAIDSNTYDIIFLDHNLPVTETGPQLNCGYELIKSIDQEKTRIICTSSIHNAVIHKYPAVLEHLDKTEDIQKQILTFLSDEH